MSFNSVCCSGPEATVSDLAIAIVSGIRETYKDLSGNVESFIDEINDQTCAMTDQVQNPGEYDDVHPDLFSMQPIVNEFIEALRQAVKDELDEDLVEAHPSLTWITGSRPSAADFVQEGYFLANHPDMGVNFYPREFLIEEDIPWMFIPLPETQDEYVPNGCDATQCNECDDSKQGEGIAGAGIKVKYIESDSLDDFISRITKLVREG